MKKTLKTQEAALENALRFENSYDLKKHRLEAGGKRISFYFINGFISGDNLLKIRIAWMDLPASFWEKTHDLKAFCERVPSFHDSAVQSDPEKAAEEVLRGSVCVTVEGLEGYLLMDLRAFQTRSISEPEKDRTMRGPHLGFNECLVSNLILIRRHLRTRDLCTEHFSIGTKIPNEVVLLSLENRRNEKTYRAVKKRLKECGIRQLSMTQETLAEVLFPQKKLAVLNPFPRVRYSERPDVVAATLLEGKIALICDNSPAVMLLPETIFDFFEETDDYYFPAVSAVYLRFVRVLVFAASVYFIPIWLLVALYENILPQNLSFILVHDEVTVPLYLQFLIIEAMLDGLKMASLNTPSTLSNSLSVIGGLILGDFAVKSGWFVPQTILYSALVGIAGMIPNNFELGYAFKFMRMSLILCVQFFRLKGLILGSAVWLIVLFSTRNVAGERYTYPFFPFSAKGIRKIIFRERKGRECLY